ncbi:MAG: SDR family oxidoreductase [Algoriphagus aquaeductus]|jgi:NAD(P)H dehydrogenase (quinone)|uniref:SDR family oxidoreductase n=1 Tax=Algoriphagus aquaeductus TaxID=475299 RepID=UPI0038795817
MKPTYLITGATGILGSQIVKHLLKNLSASQVAVLVRDPEKATELKNLGVEIRKGDYHKADSLPAALEGIEKLLLISSSDFNDRFGQHKNVIDAAVKAGVTHIFYTGATLRNPEESTIKTLLYSHFETEDYIKSTGLAYTFLRNGLYQEVIPMFAGEAVLQTGVFFPSGDGKVAFASRSDLAEATATLLTAPDTAGKVFALTGKQAYSFSEIAQLLSKLSGKDVPFVSPSSEEYENTLRSFSLPEDIITMSTLFASSIRNGDFEEENTTLEELLGRPEKSIENFLRETYSL